MGERKEIRDVSSCKRCFWDDVEEQRPFGSDKEKARGTGGGPAVAPTVREWVFSGLLSFRNNETGVLSSKTRAPWDLVTRKMTVLG